MHVRQRTAHLSDQLLLDICMATSKLKWFSPSTTTTSWIIERSKANQLCTRDLQDDVLQEEGFPHYQTLANGTCEAAQAE